MLTAKRIFECVRYQDWFAAIDLKDAYFHVSILPRHRPFLRFAFEGQAYHSVPRVFTKIVEAALVPLREHGVRILNYLDDWLILAHSRAQLCEHRDLVLRHLARLGLRRIFSRHGDRLGRHVAQLTNERAHSLLTCLRQFEGKSAVPLKTISEGSWGIWHAAATPLGLLHMRPLQLWLRDRVPRWAWHRGSLRVPVTPACRRTFFRGRTSASYGPASLFSEFPGISLSPRIASTTGWGAMCNGHAAAVPGQEPSASCTSIASSCCSTARPTPLRALLKGQHVLVRSDNTTAVAMDTVEKALEEVLTAALPQGCITVGVYEAAKSLNVDPDNVVLCLLATDEEDVKDVALQIHFTLIQAFCCENDINILRVNNMRRLAEILEGVKPGGESMDLHCVLVTPVWSCSKLAALQSDLIAVLNFCGRL
ncbi:growth arrest and DNA damage-inducible protein GADD45 gamma [Pimephales promelas]|nr:growth arrest and DNA damage-inducible protein GADD45 gamma [Pimephales promelas]